MEGCSSRDRASALRDCCSSSSFRRASRMVLIGIPLLIVVTVLRRRIGRLRLNSSVILSRGAPCSQGRSRILGNGIIERDHCLRTNDAVWGEAFAFLETGDEFLGVPIVGVCTGVCWKAG